MATTAASGGGGGGGGGCGCGTRSGDSGGGGRACARCTETAAAAQYRRIVVRHLKPQVDALAKRWGITATQLQMETILTIAAMDRDAVVALTTGSGKTFIGMALSLIFGKKTILVVPLLLLATGYRQLCAEKGITPVRVRAASAAVTHKGGGNTGTGLLFQPKWTGMHEAATRLRAAARGIFLASTCFRKSKCFSR